MDSVQAANRWRRLPPMAYAGLGAAVVWNGKRLLVWGGSTRGGLAYDPRTNRWSALPRPPLRGRMEPTAVWTGRSLIVWGGARRGKQLLDGAAYTPARAGS